MSGLNEVFKSSISNITIDVHLTGHSLEITYTKNNNWS